jgi:hypothetical protein
MVEAHSLQGKQTPSVALQQRKILRHILLCLCAPRNRRSTHAYIRDQHHQHEHLPDDPPGGPYVHALRHAKMRHRHPHVPDMHH